MATVEVPFETPERIKEKLRYYEELFKTRYTKEDEWFRRTSEMEDRYCQVPQLQPWPPSNNRRRGYRQGRRERDFTPRGKGRGHHDDSNYGPSCPSSGRQSPRLDHYEQFDYSSPRGHRGHGHTPPPAYPPSYHYYQGSSPRRYGSSPHKSGSSPRRSESSRRNEGDRFQERNVPFLRDDNTPTHLTPSGYPSSGDSSVAKRSREEESLPSESGRRMRIAPLDLKEAAGIVEEEVIPSQSDVQDILKAAASSGPSDMKTVNLKKVQKGAHQSKNSSKGKLKGEHCRKNKHRLNSDGENHHAQLSLGCGNAIRDFSQATPISVPPSAAAILVSHGETLNVPSVKQATPKQAAPVPKSKPQAGEIDVVALSAPVAMEMDAKSAVRSKDGLNREKMKKKKKKKIKETKLGGEEKKARKTKRMSSDSRSVSYGNDAGGAVYDDDDDTGDVDVTTPLIGHSPLSLTLKRSLMMEENKEMEAGDEQLSLGLERKKKKRERSRSRSLVVSIPKNSLSRWPNQLQQLEGGSVSGDYVVDATLSMATPTDKTSVSRPVTPSPQPGLSPGTCEVKFDGPSTKLIIRNLRKEKKKSKKHKKRDKKLT